MSGKGMKWLISLLLAVALMLSFGFAYAQSGDLIWLPAEETQQEDAAFEDDTSEDAAFDEGDAEEASPAEDLPAVEEYAASAEWVYPVPPQSLQSDYIRLANAECLLEDSYVPMDLVRIGVKKTSSTVIQMRQAASDALDKMFADALESGLTLYAHSGYRSYSTQRTMYYNRLEKNNGRDDGYVAKPGASDHQTGLGIDVISKAWIGKSFNSDFAKTAEAQWMAENCANYGFIIRYPEDKVDITGIAYEPWHLRYVGIAAALYMTQEGLTLEEFSEEWPPILQAFISAGGDVKSVQVAVGMEESAAPKVFTMGIYRTDIKSEDGEYEYSLFAPEESD